MKAHLITLMLVCILIFISKSITAQATKEPVKAFSSATIEFAVGASPLEAYLNPSNGAVLDFNERAFHTAFLVNVSRYFFVGFQYNAIQARLEKEPVSYHYIAGPFGRYSRPLGKRFGVMGELSIDRGNYCPCINTAPGEFENIPYKREGIYYAGSTIGGSYKLVHLLSLYGSVTYFKPLLKQPPESFDYFQPVLGLQVQLE